jgi:hypothetical protein
MLQAHTKGKTFKHGDRHNEETQQQLPLHRNFKILDDGQFEPKHVV